MAGAIIGGLASGLAANLFSNTSSGGASPSPSSYRAPTIGVNAGGLTSVLTNLPGTSATTVPTFFQGPAGPNKIFEGQQIPPGYMVVKREPDGSKIWGGYILTLAPATGAAAAVPGSPATASGSQVFSTTASPDRTALVTGARGALTNLSSQLSALLPQVKMGYGNLSAATRQVFAQARQSLENSQRKLLGDLSSNLAARRIAGSSFAADTLSRANAQFEQAKGDLAAQEGQQLAQSALQELGMTQNIINQSSQAEFQSFQTGLNELNLEANLATTLATGTATNLTQNADIQAQLAAQAQAGQGALAGTLAAPAITQIQKQVTDYVNSIFTTPTPAQNLSAGIAPL